MIYYIYSKLEINPKYELSEKERLFIKTWIDLFDKYTNKIFVDAKITNRVENINEDTLKEYEIIKKIIKIIEKRGY